MGTMGIHSALLLAALLGVVCSSIVQVEDQKDFKKLLSSRKNVLLLATQDAQAGQDVLKVLRDVATELQGTGTVATIDCSARDTKKVCKTSKLDPHPYLIHHYLDGKFNKVFDRRMRKTSVLAFMKDPTGDVPWDESEESANIVHLFETNFDKVLAKKNMLVMFYAPWCGHCKQLKPKYAEAANELARERVASVGLAAIDVTVGSNGAVAARNNVTSYPTLLYFENGVFKYKYDGPRDAASLKKWVMDPQPPLPPPPPEKKWSEEETDVIHLTKDTWAEGIKQLPSALVMFYAPWCGHCKSFKPELVSAAAELKASGQPGAIVAVDCTSAKSVCSSFGVSSYPTVKYFRNGEFVRDFNLARKAPDVLRFLANPDAPPPPAEAAWKESGSAVIHLDQDSFETTLRRRKHALVMFYAPWCGHCKKAKPEFDQAAAKFKDNNRVAIAAVDCNDQTNSALCKANDVQGFPTLRHYDYGNFVSKYTGPRTADGFVDFFNNLMPSHPEL